MARSRNTSGTRASRDSSSTRGGRRRQEAPASATPTLNERLRSKGKWVFLLLAIVFAVTFVFAGVGTSGPSLLDLLGRNSDSSPTPTTSGSASAVKKAEAAAKASPKDPQAWIALGQAEVANGDTGRVPEAAKKAAALAPRDAAVQSAIADLYLAQAGAILKRAQGLYSEEQSGGLVNGRSAVPQQVIPGGANGATPFQIAQEGIANAASAAASAKVGPLQAEATDAYKAAVAAQTVVTEVRVDDPAAWFRLGQIATSANDTKAAIAAYKRFVKLAPEDPLTTKVKDEIKRLQTSLAPVATSTTG